MYSATYLEKDIFDVVDLLHCWLKRHVIQESLSWLEQKIEQIGNSANPQVFFTAFSAVPRYTGKDDLKLTSEDLKAASTIRRDWSPSHWSVDQAARALLVLALPHRNAEKYLRMLEQVFITADVGELVALYQALPLLRYPKQLRGRAAEGVRSNMTAVFNAIALRNPYPKDFLDNLAWNQLVLKALFVGSPLHLIQGFDQRVNPELARMLVDYAHERDRANRPISYELWRGVGKFADTGMLADLERVLAQPHPQSTVSLGKSSIEQAAAALACAECPLPEAQKLLSNYPDLQAEIHAGSLSWNSLVYNINN
ncbi:EboA family metabolite traffic protein [Aetokthonos hydrillicola Thurmond2011]|jgi:hypothetical protein|uniref:EboA family metabolite traffic protein n=1 Tax=Aetokthonos hydrillicola Thurmond2011 TaxID=2712845 RepID=A0AAP5M9R8_9CYAN|nr:EboA family metabolite traffic protein [Aetokthonos hydrillicola]MBO3458959.1 EboA family metabolite traffic protein [Aetokthonos hydrillicola CCALA 1050]MBW4589066.1 EboA family metabolite traffic protein [Aetokthonos hydrillicola CCALA 1050]MDR9894978.1 EboA family metabolite traffic protein [Aetokthonos hydrillicola Thurmond2011]